MLASRHSHEPRVRENASTQPPQGRGSSNVAGEAMCIQLLTKIVESSTLPRLSAKGKEYCKTGHQLEIPLGKKLLKHSKENITIFKVEKLYRVGLVGKSDEMYAKASADFIGVACMEGVHALFAVECKGRVTPGTAQREYEHAEFLSRERDSDNSRDTELYTIVEASSSDFHKYVHSTHESVQVMHTAYVYGFEYVLLLIGDSFGNVIRGKFINKIIFIYF